MKNRKNGRFPLEKIMLRLKFRFDVAWIWAVFYWRNLLTYRHYLPAPARRLVERWGGKSTAEFETIWNQMSDAEQDRFLTGSKKSGSLSIWQMMVEKYRNKN